MATKEITDLLAGLEASYAQRAEIETQITVQTAQLQSALIRTALAVVQRDNLHTTLISNREMGYSGWVLCFNPPRDPSQPIHEYYGRMFLLGRARDAFYIVKRDDDYRGDRSPLGHDVITKLPMDTEEQIKNIWAWLKPHVAVPAPV